MTKHFINKGFKQSYLTFPARVAMFFGLVFAVLPLAVQCQKPDEAMSIRVKDLADIEGVRSNQLIGYGLVVGLNRTGDRVQQNLYARQTLQNLLERMGISTSAAGLKPENVATVLVTATLPPFIRQGSKIDVTVSSIGDARSLQGGTLILTSLKGIDGQVYAVAQGSVSIGGISAGDTGNSVEINHPTVGRVPNGANVERVVATELAANNHLTLVLRNEDFSTAAKLNTTINKKFGAGTSKAADGRNIEVSLPTSYTDNRVGFIAELENLRVNPEKIAKIIINERTGTIIMGREVRIGAVAISQGGVTIRIGTEYDVYQPAPLTNQKETAVVPRTSVEVKEKTPESVVLPDGATVDEVVRGLRTLGVSARDIISILQAIKSAGAMNADLEMQ
ncbi:MAG TPA: flagellar basal body P-ring protein FlgI [Pyrinomonadaceae bacterium]|nr:flagellar basal body P-ring protein FlgI [Pyrinomonadaceae bacterium]